MFLLLSLGAALAVLLATPSKGICRVCISPGCKDDGAVQTFECLKALAPPGVDVVKGGCVSLCGSGPVVEIREYTDDDAASFKKKKCVKGESLIALLDEFMEASAAGSEKEPLFTKFMQDRLLMGYEISLEANQAYQAKAYQSAVELYEDAINTGRKPAIALEEARAAYTSNKDDKEKYGYPPGLTWVVTSFKNSCRARLALGDIDNARRDAFASTVFSQNMDADAHECLAEVCKASGDTLGELQAVKAAIDQHEKMEEECSKPLPGNAAVARAEAAKLKRHAQQQIRELGFRQKRLEKELLV